MPLIIDKSGRPVKIPNHRQYIKQSLRKCYTEFATFGSIYGLRYTVMKGRTKFDIIFWATMIIALLFLSYIFVNKFWTTYTNFPTRYIIKSEHLLITEGRFPAVTICLPNTFLNEKRDAFIKKFIVEKPGLEKINLTMIQNSFFNLNGQLIGQPAAMANLKELQKVLNFNRLNTAEFHNLITINCNEMLQKCRWRGIVIPCKQLFIQTINFYGYCCSFNYRSKDISNFKEEKSTTHGFGSGLTVILNNINGQEILREFPTANRFLIFIHESNSFPNSDLNSVALTMNTETSIELEKIFHTATDLYKLTVKQRNCIYSETYDLEFFDEYTEENCYVEHIINEIFENCQCVPYFLPNGNLTVCDVTRYQCVLESLVTINMEETPAYCYEECVEELLRMKTTSLPLLPRNISSRFIADTFYDNMLDNSTVLHVSFGRAFGRWSDKTIIYDEIHLIGNIGGILTLFLGCSTISILEIIFIFLIHFYRWYKQFKREDLTIIQSEFYRRYLQQYHED